MDFGNYSDDVEKLLEDSFSLAEECKSRYFMPEHVLYGLTLNEDFSDCFEMHGGNCRQLQKELIAFVKENAGYAADENGMEFSEDFKLVFQRAESKAIASGREQVNLTHIFSAILSLEESYAVYFIVKQNIDLLELIGDLSRESLIRERENEYAYEDAGEEISFTEEDGWVVDKSQSKGKKERWKEYVECINDTCREKAPLIGREKELERTIQILCRMEKNNVLHVGEPGVGKTAIVYGLAQMIEQGCVPEELKNTKIFSMDMGTMVAGTQYRGEFEQRFKYVMNGLENLEKPILYMDEIHNIVGAGATGEGSLDMSNMLKPYLAEGNIRFIGATTYEEYRKHIMKSKSLLRRFQKVDIGEPSEEETVEILQGLKKRYEKFHGVKYGKGVMEYAVELSRKFVNERFLPDKAIDLIDEAGAYRKLHPLAQKTQSVNKELIDDMLSLTCNVPKQRIEKNDIEQLAKLEENLKKEVFGQDEAVALVSNAIKFSKAGLNDENKPMASFLFVGATGVGKTETAKALAKELGISFLRFDMSEYSEKHAVAKLIGAPAGYVGYEDGGLLTEEVRKHPYAVLLLDEIEKAHPDIYNILLQVMDYATLKDNQGRKADFRNIIIIMTSNAGAAGVGKNMIGFGSGKVDDTAISEAVNQTFQPEFRNRLSKIVLFHSMDDKMARKITEKKLEQLKKQMREKNVTLSFSEAAIEFIKAKGITNQYGAREIDRVIASEVKPLLVEELLFGRMKKGGNCRVEIDDKKLKII
ncbi:MAG: AAA family ATPase [Lachnospiraceae bacterium]|nr:AAA family ATPase [Lachnospiraceae bacterium]